MGVLEPTRVVLAGKADGEAHDEPFKNLGAANDYVQGDNGTIRVLMNTTPTTESSASIVLDHLPS